MDDIKMDNIETFNIIVGLVLADLYEHFPVPKDLRVTDLALKAGLFRDPSYIDLSEETPASAAIEWLIEEGFIRSGNGRIDGGFSPYCVLTHKGLQLLSLPESLENRETIGGRIAQAAKSGALEGVKSLAKTIICEGSKFALQTAIQGVMRT